VKKNKRKKRILNKESRKKMERRGRKEKRRSK
jgi:hypothetical protein